MSPARLAEIEAQREANYPYPYMMWTDFDDLRDDIAKLRALVETAPVPAGYSWLEERSRVLEETA